MKIKSRVFNFLFLFITYKQCFLLLKIPGKNGVEVLIVDGIKWLNETNIEEQLGRVNFRYTSRQNSSKLNKARLNKRLD